MMSLNLFNATHLPARENVRRLATRLTTCLGVTFFLVESPEEVESLIERVYSYFDAYNAARERRIKIQSIVGDVDITSTPLPQPPKAGEICELLAMAAVGSQYDLEASVSLRLTCFHSARFGLDDAMEEAEGGDSGDDACYRVLRLLALLAIYQILEKRGSCWWYIGTALNIAKARNLDRYDGKTGSYEDGSPEHKRLQMRKIWGTLVCIESWIGATLGKVPSTKIEIDERITMRDPVFCCHEGTGYSIWDPAHRSFVTRSLQTAILRIAVLTASIQQSMYPVFNPTGGFPTTTEPIDLSPIRMHKAALEKWFQSLPPIFHLNRLLQDEVASPSSAQCHSLTLAERSSMLLGHCLFLSATMLLTRRIVLSVINDPEGGYATLHHKRETSHLSPEKKEALEYVKSSLMAANATGEIVGLLVREDRLVSKCWMAIYPSFNASLLLLFHLTQRDLLRGESNNHYCAETMEITENVKKCLSALEFCAEGGDALAKWYLQVLAPFRQVLGEDAERDIRRDVKNTKPLQWEDESSSSGKWWGVGQHKRSSSESSERKAPYSSSPVGSVMAGVEFTPNARGRHPPPSLVGRPNFFANPQGSTISTANDFPAILAPINTGPMSSAVLSTNIYNILAVSAQASFRPEELPAGRINGIIENLHSSPTSLHPVSDSVHPDSEESLTSSSSGTGSSTGGSFSTSRSSSFPKLSPTGSPNPFHTHAPSLSFLADTIKGEKRGLAKHSPSPQPGERLGGEKQGGKKHGGEPKRVRLEPYDEQGPGGGGKQPTQEELAALLKRAA